MAPCNMIAAGIDVGKARLDAQVHGCASRFGAANGKAGYDKLIEWFTGQGVTRIGMEASGGYERGPADAFREAGFEVVLLQPRQVRAFAVYRLKRAKNDSIDAGLIARCAAELESVRAPRDPRLAALDEHLRLVEQIEAEEARLERRLAAELALLTKAILAHQDLAQRLELVESVEGVGRRTALTLLILMPELGDISREAAASLAGLAPFDDDSGKHKGQRKIAGGRARVRRALYAAALPASFR